MASTSILITGATGLIGRALTQRLLEEGHHLTLLLRPSNAPSRATRLSLLEAHAENTPGTLTRLSGDITQPHLGLSSEDGLGPFHHVFHLAALYDLEADRQTLLTTNVEGTQHLLDLLRAQGFSGTFHHVSSVAVAGDHRGRFLETDFDTGQHHPHPYHRSKFEAEKLVRAVSDFTVRIYRPSAVVGHSETGEMDRVDGPYHLFKAAQQLARALPRATPLIVPRRLPIDMVPVDYVAHAIAHIAFSPRTETTFHLTLPRPPSLKRFYNSLAQITRGPRIRSDLRSLRKIAPGAFAFASALGSLQFLYRETLRDLHIPPTLDDAINPHVRFDTTHTDAALANTPITCPRPETYLENLYAYWKRHLDPDRAPMQRDRQAFSGQRVLITGGSSGVGAALARALAPTGAELHIVARSEDKLLDVAQDIQQLGGQVQHHVVDLSDFEAVDQLVARLLDKPGGIDLLINNAARSIRRPITQSLERFHDFERVMRLNFFSPVRLIRGLLPGMRERGHGHIVNVLTSGVTLPSPRFGAYGASKAALAHLNDTLHAELLHENITCTGVYLPWVRTPMMDTTGLYEDTQAMSPEEAATWILEGIRERKVHVMDAEARRRVFVRALAPKTLARLLNLLVKLYPDHPDEHPELATDRTILKHFVKGRLL